MQVFVQLLSGKQLTLEVEGTHSVEEVKAMIEASEGIPPAEQTLLHGPEYHGAGSGLNPA